MTSSHNFDEMIGFDDHEDDSDYCTESGSDDSESDVTTECVDDDQDNCGDDIEENQMTEGDEQQHLSMRASWKRKYSTANIDDCEGPACRREKD